MAKANPKSLMTHSVSVLKSDQGRDKNYMAMSIGKVNDNLISNV